MCRKIKYFMYILFICGGVVFTNNVNSKETNKIKDYFDYVNYDWWYSFNDSNLQKYILKGLLNNNDLKILNLKVKEYGDFVKYTFGEELPTITTSLQYSNVKDIPFNNSTINSDGLMLPLNVSYELDLFGKKRLKTKSVEKQLEIYNYQLQGAYISFVSNLSTLYFNIVRYNEIISLYDELILIKNKILKDEIITYNNGLNRKVNINQTKQDIRKIKTERINILKNRDALLTQFAVMLGETPAKAKEIKITDFNKINFTGKISAPISSNIIFVRPDVLITEKQLEKAKIDIKVARREFLPTFNISGSLIFNDMASGGFFSSANTIKSLMAGVSQPLFLGGKLRFNLKMKQTQYEGLLEEYKKTSLQAVKEVNDSLVNMIYGESISVLNHKNLMLEVNNYNDYKIQYKNGLISYTDLLKTKQNLIISKINVVNSKIENYIDYISLYKATAGKINN